MTLYVLDTSVLIAHFLKEPVGTQVAELMSDPTGEVAVCVVTWLELEGKLREKGVSLQDRTNILEAYHSVIPIQLIVDGDVVARALQLRAEARSRLPAMDALIAACAQAYDVVLVHNDKHFDAIPSSLLKCWHLPGANPFGYLSSVVPPVVREKKASYKIRRKRKAAQ